MKLKSNAIHVAISFDENYITPFYVLITSIFLNNRENKIIIHSIATGVNDIQKKEIAEYVHQNKGEIFFYYIDPQNLSGLVIPENTWFSVAAYYRLFFPALVPQEVEKLLYIDTDTVVIKDLAELYQLNIGSKPVGAAREKIGNIRPEIGNYDRDNYFNSGVMLMNIQEWKKQQVTERALQFLHDFPESIKCVDQDALNAILINNWYRIDRKYNVLYQDIPMNLAKKDFKPFLTEKVIIHFSLGEHKPWCALGKNRFRYLYHDYLKKSPRHFERKYKDIKLTGHFVYQFTRIRFVESARNYPKVIAVLSAIQHAIGFLIEL